MEWTRLNDIAPGMDILILMAVVGGAIVLSILLYAVSNEEIHPVFTTLASIGSVMSIVVGIALYINLSDDFLREHSTIEEDGIIEKAKELYDPRDLTIQLADKENHYKVTVDGQDGYIFVVSDKGKHIDEIQKDGKVVYKSTEENVDEWLSDKEKVVAASLRKVTGEMGYTRLNLQRSGDQLVYKMMAVGNIYDVYLDENTNKVTSVHLISTEVLEKED